MPIARPAPVRRPVVARQQAAIDPRIERSRQVILQAVLDELSEVGYGGFAIEAAARRAGVGKATIYRHWPDKIALIADAFKLLQRQRDPEMVTGTPREKLERALRHVADVVADSPFSACLPALIEGAERDRAVRRFHHQFQAAARQPTIDLIAERRRLGRLPGRASTRRPRPTPCSARSSSAG